MPKGVTQYVKTSGGYVAYQEFGAGTRDILFVTNWSTNLEVMWEEPSLERFMDRLSTFGRVICFDKRGSGVSDPVPLASLPTLEEWMDDARNVLDAVGSNKAALIGDTEGGPMAILFAATYPKRISSLVLLNTFARFLRAEDYPAGIPRETMQKFIPVYEKYWATGEFLSATAPSAAGDPRFKQWFGHYQRLAMPPGASTTMYSWVVEMDVRAVLHSIQAPTLVLHRRDNSWYRVEHGRYLGEHIPNARYVELPGADCYPFHAGDYSATLDEIQEFLTGERVLPEPDRLLATILFTDIVDSTRLAIRMGDQPWSDLLAAHNEIIRRELVAFRGRLVSTTGDGILASFDGPARAIRCAEKIIKEVQELGLNIRTGLHTGEVEMRGEDLSGIAVHIAARVMEQAGANEVLVSRTVKDLVVGSGNEFESRGQFSLKGVPGEWELFSLATDR
jgi:class 3 adenylate cyclase/pimeloyl-ACP methyl ester carboxylesterase